MRNLPTHPSPTRSEGGIPAPSLRDGLGWCSLVPFVVAAALAGCSKPSATAPTANDALSLPIAEFALTERSGNIVKKADLHGRVWIASFIFTRCSGPCPQVTSTVARLQSELDIANEPGIRLVTFTVDPTRDNPNELKIYADGRQAHPERWLFLTGKEDEIRRLLIESFKIPVSRNEKSKKPGDEYEHSTRLVIVDKQGNIRGYYQGMADPTVEGSTEALEADLSKLKDKVKALLKE